MNRLFNCLLAVFFIALSVCFTSCSDNDDPAPDFSSDKLTVNGVQYDVYNVKNVGGGWDASTGRGVFVVYVDIVNPDKTILTRLYGFEFYSQARPKAGDNLAKAALKLLIAEWDDHTIWTGEADCMGGKAIIKSIDSDTMTVQFSNLKMEGDGLAPDGGINYEHAVYTFDGTVTVPFYFETVPM